MITYLYWALVAALCLLSVFVLAIKLKQFKKASAACLGIVLISSLAYFFHFQQVFVKHWGGVMSLSVPEGQLHMGATWKDDHLWIENYDPKSNICHFTEYSKGALLEGKVLIKNCNPLLPK
jgi:hypothetical protein